MPRRTWVGKIEKPDPRFFMRALDRAGADPATTLHVGPRVASLMSLRTGWTPLRAS